MPRAPLVVFLAVMAVAAIAALAHLGKTREVIASTPSAYTGLTVPLALPAHREACADEIVFDTDAGIARFGATAPVGGTAPSLEVTARGYTFGPYRNDYSARARVAGGWTGTRQLDVPLTPPREAVWGTFCVRNLGGVPVDLVGSQDGRAFSRPAVKVNGEPSPLELQLRLVEPGRTSVLARLGQVTTHAATLKPLGAWWMWLLALALIALAPLGLLAGMRAALAADGEARILALAWPGWVRRLGHARGRTILVAGGALAVLWLFYWSLATHVFQNDEEQYVYLSRWLHTDFPSSLWNFDLYGRGLQRLEVWLLAIPATVVSNPWALAGGRLLNTLAFVSTAIPVYLLGRGLGLSSRWAALPALLSAVVPWAVVTTAFLTENVAYPAFVWIVYTVWLAALRPGARWDALALAAIFVGGLSRSSLLVLAPVLPAVIVIVGLRCAEGAFRGRVKAVVRGHILLWAVIVVGATALALGVGPANGLGSRLAGGYGAYYSFNLWGLVEKSGRFFARVVIGTAFLPAVIGLPWLALKLVRSREPADFAFACTAVITVIALFYSLHTAGYDERYVVYLAPLVLLPGTVALARREISAPGVAIAAALLALLVVLVPWNGDQGNFAYFVWPVETFYSRAIASGLAHALPGGTGTAAAVVGIALGLGGVALAAVLRWAPGRLTRTVAITLVAAVALAIVGQTQYALSKHVDGVGSRSGPGLRARAFADSTVPGGARVGIWALGVGQLPDFQGVWHEVQFYNQRVDTVVAPEGVPVLVPPGDDYDGIDYDERTGAIRSPRPLPPYMVVPSHVDGPHLRGETLLALSYIPVSLMRLAQPATVAWRTSGFTLDGTIADGEAGGKIRVYGGECADVDLLAPPETQTHWALQAGSQVREGMIAAGKQETVTMPLRAGGDHTDITLRGDARLLNVGLHDGCHNG